MSAHDEHRVSAHLRARTYPARRRKHRGLVAAGFVFLILICVLGRCARAADFIKLTSSGTADHGDNLGFFGIPVPYPITLTVWIPLDAADESPLDPTEGVFESDAIGGTFQYGPYVIPFPTARVTVYSGSSRYGAAPSYGFQFGSDEAFDWTQPDTGEVLHVPEYQCYFLGLSFGALSYEFAPTDELEWVLNGFASQFPEGAPVFAADYTKIDGEVDGVGTRTQQTSIGNFRAEIVQTPELSQSLMCALGVLVCVGLRHRK